MTEWGIDLYLDLEFWTFFSASTSGGRLICRVPYTVYSLLTLFLNFNVFCLVSIVFIDCLLLIDVRLTSPASAVLRGFATEICLDVWRAQNIGRLNWSWVCVRVVSVVHLKHVMRWMCPGVNRNTLLHRMNECVLWQIGSASLTDAVNYFSVNLTDVSTLATNFFFGNVILTLIVIFLCLFS